MLCQSTPRRELFQSLNKLNTTTTVLPPFKEGFGPLISTKSEDPISPTTEQFQPINMKQVDYYQRSGQFLHYPDNYSKLYERTTLIHSAPNFNSDLPHGGFDSRYNSYERSSLSLQRDSPSSGECYARRASEPVRPNDYYFNSPVIGTLVNSLNGEYNTSQAAYDLTRLSHELYSTPNERHYAIALVPPMSSSLGLNDIPNISLDKVDEKIINSIDAAGLASTSLGSSITPSTTPSTTPSATPSATPSVTPAKSKGKRRKSAKKSKSFSDFPLPTTPTTPAAIRLSQKRYSVPKPGDKKTTQGRPFTDSMSVNLTMTSNVDDIFISCLGLPNHASKNLLVEFTQPVKDEVDSDASSPKRRSSVSSSNEEDKIIIDHNHIASGIRELFSIKDFYFVQVVRSSTNQDRSVDRDIKSLPAQKLISIPCPENDDEITCKFLKQSIAHPRYKCNMKFYIVEGKIDNIQWNYTSHELMEQEKRQIAIGELVCPLNVTLNPPSVAMLQAITGRRTRRNSTVSKKKSKSKGEKVDKVEEGDRVKETDPVDSVGGMERAHSVKLERNDTVGMERAHTVGLEREDTVGGMERAHTVGLEREDTVGGMERAHTVGLEREDTVGYTFQGGEGEFSRKRKASDSFEATSDKKRLEVDDSIVPRTQFMSSISLEEGNVYSKEVVELYNKMSMKVLIN